MTYLDDIEKRCNKFKFGSDHYGHSPTDAAFAAEAELDHAYAEMVPELLRRLRLAIVFIERHADFPNAHKMLAELKEAAPGDEK